MSPMKLLLLEPHLLLKFL